MMRFAASSQLASVFSLQGVHTGDVVAVFAANSPEMILSIAAVSKLGAIPALINTSLQSKSTHLPTFPQSYHPILYYIHTCHAPTSPHTPSP